MQKADNGARTPSGGPNSATEGGSPPRASSARGPSNLTAPLQQGNHNNVEASAPESPRPSADGKTYWRYEDLERKFNTAIPRPAIPNPRKLRLVLVFKNLRQDQPSAVTCSRARLVLVFNNLRPDQPSAVTCSRARLVLVFNNLRQDQPSAITCSRASPLSYNDAANGASASKKRRFRAGATLSSDDSEAPPAKKPKRQVDGGAAPSFNGSKGSASRKRRVRDQASLSSDEPKAPPAKKHKRRAGGCATPSPVGRKVSASKETRAGGSTIVKTAAKSKRRVPGGKRARSLGKTTETKNRKLAYKRRQKLKDTYGFRSSRPRASQYKKIGGETRGRMSEFIHRELPPLSGPRALQYKKKGGKKRGSMREFIHRELPPLSDIHEIFDDMSTAAISNEEFELRETLGRLNGKTINVATMCSGTESPLLALNMCKDGKVKKCVYV